MKTIGLDISVLNEKNRTGIEVYTYELINALLKINQRDKFILFGFSTLQTYDYLKSIDLKKYPNAELKIVRLPSKLMRRSFLLWQKTGFPKIEQFIGPVDVFHSFNWYLPPQKKGKCVATIFDLTSILYPQWHDRRTVQMDNLRFKQISKKADLVIAISEHSKNDFLKYYPDANVEVIYPAASDKFKPTKNKDLSVLKKYGIDGEYILSVATLEPRKNIEMLIRAYLKINPKEQLVLVGGKGWKNSLITELASRNKEKIKITGFVMEEDLIVLYQQATLFVYPSLYEGFGIPVLEAMSAGTPVITSNVSSLPEVGDNAVIYINPQDQNDLENALIKTLRDKKLREELRKKGLLQAKKFSWEKSAEKLNQLYLSL